MQTKSSIRAQIVKTLLILGIAMITLLVGGGFVVFGLKDPLTAILGEYNSSRDAIYKTQLSLERLEILYKSVYLSKPENAKQYLESIESATLSLADGLEQLSQQQEGKQEGRLKPEILRDIRALRDALKESGKTEREAATRYVNGSAAPAASIIADILKRIDVNKQALWNLKERLLSHYQREFISKIQGTFLLLVPILIALFLIPISVFFATMRKINRDLIGYIRTLYGLSEQNETSSERLKMSSELMSTASSQQSAAIQQTASSITQIRSMLAETENRVREVQSLTSEMDSETSAGREIMQKLEKSMQTIEETNRQIESFEEILSQIQQKTQVINDIVFKTQLLSFNASIEAARAGQYGRGFSVVAEEVGKLAMMSGDAAREIDQLLGQSAERVSKIVESVNEKVRDGKVVSQSASSKFGELASRTRLISGKVDQVANATAEQAGSIEQTARAMEQVNLGALENKRGSEEIQQIADAVFGLSAKIREVSTGIRRFVREEQGALNLVKEPAPVEATTPQPEVKPVSPARVQVERPKVRKERSSEPVKVVSVAGRRAARQISADDPSFKKVVK